MLHTLTFIKLLLLRLQVYILQTFFTKTGRRYKV